MFCYITIAKSSVCSPRKTRRVYNTTTEGTLFLSFYEEGMLCRIVEQTIELDGFDIYVVTARVLESNQTQIFNSQIWRDKRGGGMETEDVPTRFVAYKLY